MTLALLDDAGNTLEEMADVEKLDKPTLAEQVPNWIERVKQDQVINRLVDEAEEEKWTDDALDELVHESAQEGQLDDLNAIERDEEQDEHIGGVEQDASTINNAGLFEQLRYLLESGVSETRIVEAATKK